ncbi:HIT-like protein [Whalleya microplaca]|nr:HIT-like protein [Whalleya microplaca]
MATADSDPEDAITKDEIAGTAPAPPATESGISQGTKRNAFTELMAPKPKPVAPAKELASTRSAHTKSFKDRDGLGAYTDDPASFPPDRVISYNDDFVAINDMYPKSTVHTLLLPRSPLSRLHPFDAFEDRAFLASVQAETTKLRQLVAKELQRRYGRYSASDRAREAVLNGETETGELPRGRDWGLDLLVGVHAHPSMNDLHVHVLAPDMVSACMRHRKHYNSFTTPFLIDVADFPLAADDPRRHPGRAGFLEADLKCWRCGRNFGRGFKQLKEHLDVEFEEWKKQ